MVKTLLFCPSENVNMKYIQNIKHEFHLKLCVMYRVLLASTSQRGTVQSESSPSQDPPMPFLRLLPWLPTNLKRYTWLDSWFGCRAESTQRAAQKNSSTCEINIIKVKSPITAGWHFTNSVEKHSNYKIPQNDLHYLEDFQPLWSLKCQEKPHSCFIAWTNLDTIGLHGRNAAVIVNTVSF